jgi:F-type H+-transporting ATPase subunit gamma
LQKQLLPSRINDIFSYDIAYVIGRSKNMSQLVQMRQRIKAIETIKKITYAMRLISMSAHSRLKRKQDTIIRYIETIEQLFGKIYKIQTNWVSPIINPSSSGINKQLVILVGSQKGLCGNFNSNLAYFFETQSENEQYTYDSVDLIIIGKKILESTKNLSHVNLIATYETFNMSNLFSIAQLISDTIINAHPMYTKVTLLSNQLKGFFIQKPHETILVPFSPSFDTNAATPLSTDDFIWEHEPKELLTHIANQYLEAQIQYLLFQSLYAEQAARFVSMDNATRNAESLLESTRLTYNKLRQAKITKELTELTSSF